jgi:hypothetical protein
MPHDQDGKRLLSTNGSKNTDATKIKVVKKYF